MSVRPLLQTGGGCQVQVCTRRLHGTPPTLTLTLTLNLTLALALALALALTLTPVSYTHLTLPTISSV